MKINPLLKLESDEIAEYARIAFCQPKFYKTSAWNMARRVMELVAIPNNLAFRRDYGKGKGKYDSLYSIDYVVERIGVITDKLKADADAVTPLSDQVLSFSTEKTHAFAG
jgi:hypothetical protein